MDVAPDLICKGTVYFLKMLDSPGANTTWPYSFGQADKHKIGFSLSAANMARVFDIFFIDSMV